MAGWLPSSPEWIQWRGGREPGDSGGGTWGAGRCGVVEDLFRQRAVSGVIEQHGDAVAVLVEHGPGAELGVLDTPAARLRLAAVVPATPADVAVTAGDNLGAAEVAGQRRPSASRPLA